MKTYDFSGWATRNGLKCSDGRTIMKDAFIENDGKTVPLVWNHQHNDPSNVLGHALLQNRDEGVYAYCSFNDTESGAIAKALVQHGDIVSLSIYANQLKQNGSNVMHGMIREVSLVHAGANPGAYIEDIVSHADGVDGEAVVWNDPNEVCIELYHAEEEPEKKEQPKEESKPEEKENKDMAEGKTIGDVVKTMNEEQKKVLYALVGLALEDGKGKSNDMEDEGVKHNVFESDYESDEVLVHDAMNEIMKEGKRTGSLKEAYLAHAAEYGIENIDFINTEEKDIYDKPQWINNQPSDWVSVVIGGVHHTPFEKVRMQFADITADEARAKGYIKGKYKKEEVFKLLKRVVSGTMIYKKQKFDRQDIIDADFDIIPWVKSEMNIKFDEEKARAYIFGDGRDSSDEDKVDESKIIPVIKDEDLFTIKKTVTPEANESLEHAIITAAVLAQDDYQGSGNLTGFFEAKQVSKMLLMEDQFGHRLYKTINELATAMGISKIVKVPAGICPQGFYGVMLDLRDYNVGQKNAGKKSFFENFDIDYNQQKYLMEEQQSGALTRPYSAIVLSAANG
jgi:hypothetical protein